MRFILDYKQKDNKSYIWLYFIYETEFYANEIHF